MHFKNIWSLIGCLPLVAGAALPIAAIAQPAMSTAPVNAPRRISGPVPSRTDGITVTGRATVRIPATRMRINVNVYGRGPTQSFDDAGKAIAQAMQRNGVPDARWVLPLSGGGNGNTQGTATGSIDGPTREKVETITRSVLKTLPESVAGSITNYNVQTLLAASDCSAEEARAIDAAIADARRRGMLVARAASVRLGDVVSVNATSPGTGQGCPTSPDDAPSYAFNGYQPGNDPSGSTDIIENVFVTVTFAVR